MPFAYYDRLSPEEQLVYRASDLVTGLRLPRGAALAPHVRAVEAALGSGDARRLQRASGRLVRALCAALGTRAPRVEVLEVRPTFTGGELHGLYTLTRGGRATVQVWMRTARLGRVVAFRTFLRTLLHEVLHHLDLRLLRLPASFHTEGFFQRESSLFRQLVPEAGRRARASAPEKEREGTAARGSPRASRARRGARSLHPR